MRHRKMVSFPTSPI